MAAVQVFAGAVYADSLLRMRSPEVIHYRNVDVLLGGLRFSGQTITEDDYKYGQPYLEPIYASQLFELIGFPSLEDYARMRAEIPIGLPQVPGAPAPAPAPAPAATPVAEALNVPAEPKVVITDAIRKEYVAEVSKKLNQVFVLKTLANILDTEAYLMNQSSEVPFERVEYAVRKILFVDGKRIASECKDKKIEATAEEQLRYRASVFDEYIDQQIRRYEREGSNGYKILGEMGIDASVRSGDPKARQQLRAALEPVMTRYIRSNGADRAQSGRVYRLPSIDELSQQLIAYYKGTLSAPEEWVLFERMKAAIGNKPFGFAVRWIPGRDARMQTLAREFKEQWPAARIMGQSPYAADAFPQTLAEFREFVKKKLQPIPTYFTRQKIANTIMLKDWRNADLLNPRAPRNSKYPVEVFNPLGPARLFVTEKELNDVYNEVKDEIAAQVSQDFTLTEIKLGALAAKRPAPVADNDDELSACIERPKPEVAESHKPCIVKFKEAFETPYTTRQKEIRDRLVAELKEKKITREQFNEAVLKARLDLPAEVYPAALEAMRAHKYKVTVDGVEVERGCAEVHAELKVHKINQDSRGDYSRISDDERARMMFVAQLQSDMDLQRMMIPNVSQIDTGGNVHHYFFHRASEPKVEYLSPEDKDVNMAVRDIIANRRVADRMGESLKSAIGKRYVVHAETRPFAYNGVEGFSLKQAVKEPNKWIKQMFQGRNTKILESAYQMP